jgi:hypothetical protein
VTDALTITHMLLYPLLYVLYRWPCGVTVAGITGDHGGEVT